MRNTKAQFVRSLGYPDGDPEDHLYSALMLQPRIVGAVTVTGVLLQAPWLFLALSAALAWSAVAPAWSLFDAIYNDVIARMRQRAPVAPAPAPRRFAGGLASIVTLAIGVALATGARGAAWGLEALMVFAVAAVVFGRACAGADLYHALCRRWLADSRCTPERS